MVKYKRYFHLVIQIYTSASVIFNNNKRKHYSSLLKPGSHSGILKLTIIFKIWEKIHDTQQTNHEQIPITNLQMSDGKSRKISRD